MTRIWLKIDAFEIPDPDPEFHPRIQLKGGLMRNAGILGMEMMREMFNEPFKPFLPDYRPSLDGIVVYRWDMEQLAQCIGLGLVGMDSTGNGFQLTPDGRYYMAEWIILHVPSVKPLPLPIE